MPQSPFKFLDSFTKEDKDIFFGRDKEIEELYSRVFESNLLLVYGVSGTGKSSLINCGLANKFDDTDWLPINIRRGSNINESLARAISKHALTPLKSTKKSPMKGGHVQTAGRDEGGVASAGTRGQREQLVKVMKSLYLDHFKPIYLIFDQFEELFIFGTKAEKEEFILHVKTILDAELQCRFIFVIREEYLAGLTEFESVIPTLFSNRTRIEKMTRTIAVETIEGPCKVHNIQVDEGFAQKLLEILSPDKAEIELAYLQVYLDKLFTVASEKGGESPVFSIELLDEIGQVTDLLGSFLEEQVNELEDPESGLTILKTFVSIKGTKRQITAEEVKDYYMTLGKEITSVLLRNYIEKFVNLRLLKDKDENDRYELRHDSVAEIIYEKITLVEKELLEIRQFLDNAFDIYEKRDILLDAKDLKYIAFYEDKLFLSKELQEFWANSKSAISARQRMGRRITYAATFVFLLMMSAVGYFGFVKITDTAAQDLATKAMIQKDVYPVLSFENAVAAYKEKPELFIARKAIFDAFYTLLEKGPYYDPLGNELYPKKQIFDFTPCQANILSAKFSKDGKFIYGHLGDSTVKVWTARGKEVVTLVNEAPVIAVNFSPDNKYVAVVGQDGLAIVWNTDGEPVCSLQVVYDPINPQKVVSFSPDSRFIASATVGNRVRITSIEGEDLYYLKGHTASVTAVVFSPDGRFLASCSKDKSVILWYHFSHYNRFTEFGGIVWSAEFSGNSKYILTACSDTLVRIMDLNGKVIMNFGIWYSGDEKYAKKYNSCNASFAMNELAILVTAYTESDNPARHNNTSTNLADEQIRKVKPNISYINKFGIWYLKPHLLNYDRYNDTIFSHVDFSSNEEYAAITIHGSNSTQLITEYLDIIGSVPGVKPQFSPDGNYLLCVDGNQLSVFVASEKEIIRLVYEAKIFDKLKREYYFEYSP